jgi:glycopeptide antibiotics resistance protein
VAVTATLTLGPSPVRLLTYVTSAVSSITGESPGSLRPVVEAGSNVLMFAAVAIALLIAVPRLAWWHGALGLVVASGTIELVQGLLLPGRHAELQDVALNGLGAWMGCATIATVRRRRASAGTTEPPGDDVPGA